MRYLAAGPTASLKWSAFQTSPLALSKSIRIALLCQGTGTHPATLNSNRNPKLCFVCVCFFHYWGRAGLVNCLERGFCTKNEAGQSGATQLGMCGMSSGSSRAISITQPVIKATRAQSPGNWLKATQSCGFLPQCCWRVCGLPKKNSKQTAFALKQQHRRSGWWRPRVSLSHHGNLRPAAADERRTCSVRLGD